MRYSVRCYLRIMVAMLALALSGVVLAQDYPVRVVRIVVPYPAGGGLDIMARALSDRLNRRWGQPVVVDNKPGGGSLIGTEAVARAAPDGYTLLLTTDATMTSNPFLYQKLPYDPVKDFAPITQLLRSPLLVIAHPSLAASTLPQLAGQAKSRPGTLNYGSMGSASQPHLLYEGFSTQVGARLTHVPYKGMAPALQAVLSGEVQLSLAPISLTKDHVRAGKLKALAVASPTRSPVIPEIPTLAEAGFPDIDPNTWFGLFAPAGTPSSVVTKIHSDIGALFTDPDFRDRVIVDRGYEAAFSPSPEAFVVYIRNDLAYKGKLIKNAKIQPE